MKEQQAKKNCQTFMAKLQNTHIYESVKDLLLEWKRQDKQNVPAAITKVVHHFGQEEKDEKIVEYYNRCLVKDAIVPKRAVTPDELEEVASQNPQATQILDNVKDWVKKETKPPEKAPPKPIAAPEEIKDSLLMARLEAHPSYREIIKIFHIYLKSIISFQELKALLQPLYASDPSLMFSLLLGAQDIIAKRRRACIFAPLNELVDKKYPNLEQVGESYILIPEGYANYGKRWKTNELEYIMNRKYVSVPLGSEVSFIINKKTDYEEQLFSYEDQRYEVDIYLNSLRAAIALIKMSEQAPHKMENVLVHRVINDIYPNQNVSSIFIKNPELARNVLLPRIVQKRDELLICREKFVKVCEEIAAKNFYKSLDYRCFYFTKNDKKFNCPVRWEKEIEMRKQQILEKKDTIEEEQVQDRESLQRGRYFYVNSFDNITKENFIENKKIQANFDLKLGSQYPKHPENQILFILNFADEDVLNDVLEVILCNCTRKSLLQLLIFKMMRIDIKKKLKKSPLFNHILQNKEKIANNPQIAQILANIENPSYAKVLQQQGYPSGEQTLLNDSKGNCKAFKDSEDEFMQMIEEDEEPVQLEDQESPFEGPAAGFTFIVTKPIYIFMRYVLAIYQRFLKAKEYSQQFSGESRHKIDIYKFFLTVLIYKIRDRKYFEEYLRKLFCKNAFIFFTLEKMILSAAKSISNITTESLSYQIIKDQTKDYDLGVFDWEKYCFSSVTSQLTRLYMQEQTLFRFTFEPSERNFYVSSWNPPFNKAQAHPGSHPPSPEDVAKKLQKFTTEPIRLRKEKIKPKVEQSEQAYHAEEITREQRGKLMLRGEYVILSRSRHEQSQAPKQLLQELHKIRKIRNFM